MAVTYGMGQYRINNDTSYIEKLNDISIQPKYLETQINTYIYRDIYFDLHDTPIRYNEVYFLELTLPRHVQYTNDIAIKICGESNNGTIDIANQFQNIKQIVVPSSLANANFYQDVLLYEKEEGITEVGIVSTDSTDYSENHIWYDILNNKYWKNISQGTREELGDSYQLQRITESWKLKEITEDTITYNLIFSPKFDIGSTYPYLYLEIDRNNDWNTNIQYIENEKTYRGIYIDTELVTLNIYKVNNLLGNNATIAPSKLNHIGVWGHPEMYLAINGEQIQIGKTGLYELDDFEITNLGVVVQDFAIDRFTIDYEFKT